MFDKFSFSSASVVFSHLFVLTHLGVLKRKKASSPECAIKVSRTKINKSQLRLPFLSVGYIALVDNDLDLATEYVITKFYRKILKITVTFCSIKLLSRI